MDPRARATNVKPDLYVRAAGKPISNRGSAANYYLLTAFVAVTLFIVVWASMNDRYDETPVLIAAIASGLSVTAFVLFREIVLRRMRERALAARRLAHHLRSANRHVQAPTIEGRLSIRRNDELLREIRIKSEAAKVLGKLADAHREVFELCDEYLKLISKDSVVLPFA